MGKNHVKACVSFVLMMVGIMSVTDVIGNVLNFLAILAADFQSFGQ